MYLGSSAPEGYRSECVQKRPPEEKENFNHE